jgi:glutamate carboxypeptidase
LDTAVSFEPRRFTQSDQINDSLAYDLKLLEKMVLCSSPSKDFEGVMKVQHMIADELRSIGFQIKWVPSLVNPSHFLLHGHKRGNIFREMTFVSHADTVLAPNSNFQYKVNFDENRIYGSGVADDKGGVVVALRGIREFLKKNPDHYHSLNFISSPNEEVGSIGFHQYFQELGERSDYVFGFEPSLVDGAIISSRNGNAWYRLTVKGKSSHAGRFGEESINAAHELSRIISSLYVMNDIKNKIKVNVGSISGGTGHFNVVCGEASALIDMRFPSPSIQKRMHETFEALVSKPEVACLETGKLPTISYDIEDNCPPLPYNDKSLYIANLFKKYIFGHEQKIVDDRHTGGAADVNYFASNNTTIDGLGPIGGGLHTIHEYIELSSLVTRAQSLSDVLADIDMEGDSYGH